MSTAQKSADDQPKEGRQVVFYVPEESVPAVVKLIGDFMSTFTKSSMKDVAVEGVELGHGDNALSLNDCPYDVAPIGHQKRPVYLDSAWF